MNNIRFILILTAPLILFACSDEQPSAHEQLVEQWYVALESSDRSRFATIISEKANIEIKDLGIIQTKREFIEALDSWEEASKELKLSHTLESSDENSAMVEVCYEFPSNSFTNEEVFIFSEGKVISQTQQQIEEGC